MKLRPREKRLADLPLAIEGGIITGFIPDDWMAGHSFYDYQRCCLEPNNWRPTGAMEVVFVGDPWWHKGTFRAHRSVRCQCGVSINASAYLHAPQGVAVIGEHPAAHKGQMIFNAPRPLPGHTQWQDEFRHGVFYSAITPDLEDSDELVRDVIAQDGWLVWYVTKERAIKCMGYLASLKKASLAKYDDNRLVAMFLDYQSRSLT